MGWHEVGWFIFGAFVGGVAMLIVVTLMIVAGENDRENDRLLAKMRGDNERS